MMQQTFEPQSNIKKKIFERPAFMEYRHKYPQTIFDMETEKKQQELYITELMPAIMMRVRIHNQMVYEC